MIRRKLSRMDSDDWLAIFFWAVAIIGIVLVIAAVLLTAWLLPVKLAVIGGTLLIGALFGAMGAFL